ncbi:MAG: archease [Methanomicrobiaceae archaeon]|nr:archease [Methanomicrobiaceae archaeon]
MPFEELEHTADVRIRVRGEGLEELFSEAARALSHVIFGGAARDRGVTHHFTLEGEISESLLAEFLSELLFLLDAEGIAFSRVEVELGEKGLSAVVHGEPVDPDRHSEGAGVKGISYSGLKIIKQGEEYVVDILLDV